MFKHNVGLSGDRNTLEAFAEDLESIGYKPDPMSGKFEWALMINHLLKTTDGRYGYHNHSGSYAYIFSGQEVKEYQKALAIAAMRDNKNKGLHPGEVCIVVDGGAGMSPQDNGKFVKIIDKPKEGTIIANNLDTYDTYFIPLEENMYSLSYSGKPTCGRCRNTMLRKATEVEIILFYNTKFKPLAKEPEIKMEKKIKEYKVIKDFPNVEGYTVGSFVHRGTALFSTADKYPDIFAPIYEEEIKVGTWVKSSLGSLYKVLNTSRPVQLLNVDGIEFNTSADITSLTLATKKEIKEVLIKYANERYSNGSSYNTVREEVRPGDTPLALSKPMKQKIGLKGDSFEYNMNTDTLYNYGRGLFVIYEKGVWATPVKEENITVGSNNIVIVARQDSLEAKGKSSFKIEDIDKILVNFNKQIVDNVADAGYGVYIDETIRFIRIGCASENHLFSITDLKAIRVLYNKVNR